MYHLNPFQWRHLVALIGIASLFIVRAPANADVDVHVGIGIPSPPVVTFEHEPEVVVVPHSHVYYAPSVNEYDMYRSGNYWYVNRDGYWYRSHGYRGPFRAVHFEQVPHAIAVLPGEYRHHPLRPEHPGHGHARGHYKHEH